MEGDKKKAALKSFFAKGKTAPTKATITAVKAADIGSVALPMRTSNTTDLPKADTGNSGWVDDTAPAAGWAPAPKAKVCDLTDEELLALEGKAVDRTNYEAEEARKAFWDARQKAAVLAKSKAAEAPAPAAAPAEVQAAPAPAQTTAASTASSSGLLARLAARKMQASGTPLAASLLPRAGMRASAKNVDVTSAELFPTLGGAPAAKAHKASAWGAVVVKEVEETASHEEATAPAAASAASTTPSAPLPEVFASLPRLPVIGSARIAVAQAASLDPAVVAGNSYLQSLVDYSRKVSYAADASDDSIRRSHLEAAVVVVRAFRSGSSSTPVPLDDIAKALVALSCVPLPADLASEVSAVCSLRASVVEAILGAGLDAETDAERVRVSHLLGYLAAPVLPTATEGELGCYVTVQDVTSGLQNTLHESYDDLRCDYPQLDKYCAILLGPLLAPLRDAKDVNIAPYGLTATIDVNIIPAAVVKALGVVAPTPAPVPTASPEATTAPEPAPVEPAAAEAAGAEEASGADMFSGLKKKKKAKAAVSDE